MIKLIGIALIALLSFVGSAYGAVSVDDIDGYVGDAVHVDIVGQKSTFNGDTVQILANGHKEGVTANVSTESHLTSAALAYGVIRKVSIDSTDDVKVTLANGTPGQMVTIMLTDNVSGGDWVITDDGVSASVASALLSTGWDDLTFDTDLDSITLLYVDDTYGWIIVGNNGVTVT